MKVLEYSHILEYAQFYKVFCYTGVCPYTRPFGWCGTAIDVFFLIRSANKQKDLIAARKLAKRIEDMILTHKEINAKALTGMSHRCVLISLHELSL